MQFNWVVSWANFLRRFLTNQGARSFSALFQENGIYRLNKHWVALCQVEIGSNAISQQVDIFL